MIVYDYDALVRENELLKEEIMELEKELRNAYRDMQSLENDLHYGSRMEDTY